MNQEIMLNKLLESETIFVIKTDRNANYTYANKAFIKKFIPGVTDILSTSSMDAVIEEDHAVCLQTVEKCFAEPGKMHKVILRKPIPGGGIYTNQWEFTGLPDSKGVVNEILCMGFSIDESINHQKNTDLLLDRMSGVLSKITAAGIITYVSSNWERLYGYSVSETLGKPFTEFVHPEDVEKCYTAIQSALTSNKFLSTEFRIKIKNGNWIWLATQANSSDTPGELVLTSHDITHKKAMEEQLYQSLEMFQNIMDQFPGVIFWKDTNSKYLGCNDTFLRAAGLSRLEEIIGKTDFDLPWAETEATDYIRDDQDVIKSGQSRLNIIETQHTHNGETTWFNTNKIALKNSQEEIIGVLGVSIDITESKKAEEAIASSEKQLRFMAEHTSDAIIMNNNYQIAYVSSGYEKISGFTSDEVISKTAEWVFKNIHPEDGPGIKEKIYKAIEEKIPQLTYQFRALHKKGHYYWREDNASFFYDSRGNYEKSVVIARDITIRKKQEELEQQIKTARETIEFKQKFLASMSHEIRTPLTGVLGMAEILSQTPLDPEQREYLEALSQSGESLKGIINSILEFSKIEAGGISLVHNDFYFEKLSKNAENLFFSICKKNISFQWKTDKAIPEMLRADAPKINQIINNLISNAVKFTREGQITTEAVLLNEQPLEGDPERKKYLIKITVSDTGIGIKKESQKKLFQPFFQADQLSESNALPGTGLGLSISRELAQLMGGEMRVKSTQGEGSTFWFTFEAQTANSIIGKDTNAQKSETNNAKSRNLSILVAEDKKLNQKVIELILGKMGHKVTFTCNGVSALKIFKPGLFDLIIMDVQMPLMDGVSATRELRKKFPANQLPPILGLSANAFEGDREKYMQSGMDEYITKPINIDELKTAIKKLTR